MGRAARSKRQRSHTRTWQTRNPWTGKVQTFPVCVSDEALREWEENRVRLAKAGYPDRPPEFDSPRHRLWNSEPGKAFGRGALAGAVCTLGADPTAKALGTWRSGNGVRGAKVNIGRRENGAFVLHIVLQEGQEELSGMIDVPDERAARAFIEWVDAQLVSPFGLPPLSWTSFDELLAEAA